MLLGYWKTIPDRRKAGQLLELAPLCYRAGPLDFKVKLIFTLAGEIMQVSTVTADGYSGDISELALHMLPIAL